MTPLEAKTELTIVKRAFGQGKASEAELILAAETYIDSIKQLAKKNKKRYPVPSLQKLLR